MSKTRLIAAALVATLGAALAHDTASACEKREEFRARRAAIAKMTEAEPADLAREHYMLGLWAGEKGLTAESRASFEKALSFDADHEGARGELGHVRNGDQWLTHSEAMKAKGLVMRAGAWILREEAEILDLPKKQRELRREGQAKVRKLLDMYAKGGDRARKFARASLDTVESEHKVEPMAFALRSRSEDAPSSIRRRTCASRPSTPPSRSVTPT